MIMFRFTIGSYSDKVLSFWESNAPCFKERFDSLKYAFNEGFQTSVSCEPVLDGSIPIVVYKCLPFITGTIWLGQMNDIKSRVDISNLDDDNACFLYMAQHCQDIDFVQWLYAIYRDNSKVRWKESYKKVLGLPDQQVVE